MKKYALLLLVVLALSPSAWGHCVGVPALPRAYVGAPLLPRIYVAMPAPTLISATPTIGVIINGSLIPDPTPSATAWPNACLPANPSVPTVPGVPTAPSVPTVPNVPTNPCAPTVPSVPTIPSLPANPLRDQGASCVISSCYVFSTGISWAH